MDVSAQADLTLLRCDHMSRTCDCEAEDIYPLRIRGTVHEGPENYAIEVLEVDGLPEGMTLADLDPQELERLQDVLLQVAQRRFAAMDRLAGQLEKLASDLRSFLMSPPESFEEAVRWPYLVGKHRGAIQSAVAELELLLKGVRP